MNQPWYHEGLRFRCTQCGHCCTGEPGFVWVNEEEIQTLADYLGEPPQQVQSYYTRPLGSGRSLREKTNGDCVFYDRTVGCTVYPVRPRQCRTWPFWASNVESPSAWEETCRICPGSGQGDLISEEEITQRIKVIRM